VDPGRPITPPPGYLCLVLHAHLPFVRHPEEEYFLEENWLYEALTETYIPLINVFEQLIRDRVPFRLTMSLTPPLVSMLRDPLLQSRYIRYLDRLIELSGKEIERTGYQPHFHGLALMYNRRFQEMRDLFANRYQRDLVGAFKRLQDQGFLEILASCATHGVLPVLNVHPESVRAQIHIGVKYYQKIFGRPPKGLWLPECAYFRGVDEILKEEGVRYFFIESHGIIHGDPSPRYSVYAPVYCPSGVAAFGRDWESSKQVWSAHEGYPGDPAYREYYRDIGYEMEYEYLKPYLHPQGFRINTGLKYWRITGPTEAKEPYQPDWAKDRASIHAEDFIHHRHQQIAGLAGGMDRRPIVVAPYDAELFGHWWFEGPLWLDFLLRKIARPETRFRTTTPSEYLIEYPTNQMVYPSSSSWGYKGYNEYWIEGSNDWIYRHLHLAGGRMTQLADRFLLEKNSHAKRMHDKEGCALHRDGAGHTSNRNGPASLTRRALNQAARELLLAQASDWPFIMKSGTVVSYAHRRVKNHLSRFNRLYHDLLQGTVDENWLKELENRDNIFSDMDCAVCFRKRFKNGHPISLDTKHQPHEARAS